MSMLSLKNPTLQKTAALFLIAAVFVSGVNFVLTRTASAQKQRQNADDSSAPLTGDISGVVYIDYNMNGARDTSGAAPNYAIDSGVSGVTVTAFDSLGVGTAAITDSAGAYSISAPGTGPYRVEFTTLPSGYYPSAVGSDNASTVRVVPDGTTANVDLGIIRNRDFTQKDPLLVTPLYTNGDPLAGGTAGQNFALTGFRYSGTSPKIETLAIGSQIGATWGIGYQANRSRVFSAATIKRHVGLGPQGKGGVYVTNLGATYTTSSFVDLTAAPYNLNLGALGDNPARGLPILAITPNNDVAAFAAVGKQGLGDIDIDETGNNLWGVNINSGSQSIWKLDVANTTPGTFVNYPLSGFTGVPTCTNGVFRPWAIAFANDLGYLGGVCSAELAGGVRNNLVGYVLSFDPNSPTAFTTVLTIPLNYDKGIVYNDLGNPFPANTTQWYPWTDTYSDVAFNMSTNGRLARPTPILSDIEFDTNGAVAIGFIDRATSQLGYLNYRPIAADTTFRAGFSGGDILRACISSGVWSLENNGACGSSTGAGVGNAEGPGGGEFYARDNIIIGSSGNHNELSNGALAVLRGSREVVSTAYDPVNEVSAQGVIAHSNLDGSRLRGFQLYANGIETTNGFFGKANGVGDLELLKEDAPLQVGNLVWVDTDGDGIQDPNEAGMPNVTVQLWADTDDNGTVDTQVGTATTDSNGNYVFGGINNSNMANDGNTCTFDVASHIVASSDDGRELAAGGVASNFTTLVYDTSRINAFRFTNLAVPKGATINAANITLTADASNAAATVNLQISAEDVGNAATISPVNFDLSTRTLSPTTTDWNAVPAFVSGTKYTTPNIAATLQSITDRADWASGNSLMLMMRNNGSTAGVSRSSRSTDAGMSLSPTLQVNYSMPCKYTLNQDTAYQVRVPSSNFDLGEALFGFAYTRRDINSGPNADARDSDGSFSGGHVVKNFTTGGSAENDHTYDFGFLLAPTTANVSVQGRVTLPTGSGVRNATIILTEANGTRRITRTGSLGYYRFDAIVAGQTVVVGISSKRFIFNPSSRVVSLADSVADVDFIAQE